VVNLLQSSACGSGTAAPTVLHPVPAIDAEPHVCVEVSPVGRGLKRSPPRRPARDGRLSGIAGSGGLQPRVPGGHLIPSSHARSIASRGRFD
jgi:hypothetical protein